MKTQNQVTLEFPSRSANESFARTAAACFAAQLCRKEFRRIFLVHK